MEDEKNTSNPSTTEKQPTLQNILEEINLERDREADKAANVSLGPTEYKKFCREHSGPIEIKGLDSRKEIFRSACWEYPLGRFMPIIERWQQSEATGIRHWPHMALASSRFRFQQNEFKRYGKAPSRQEIAELLSNIESAADRLASSMLKLQSLASQINDGYSPHAIPHLVWLDQYIAQAAAGAPSKEVNQAPSFMTLIILARQEFLARILSIQAAAKTAIPRMDPDLLKQPKRGEIRALRNLVRASKPIWQSLTNRRPSIHKVAKGTPDFVQFVQALSKIGGGPIPTPKQVEAAFRPIHPPELPK
jgi:hypothetical protein